jgi:hypothetical protein
MIRARVFTNLVVNLILAVWVLHDARTRKARKPLFAAFLALLWGPLGVAFWASERPLGSGERRTGGRGRVFARTFLLLWTALLPAVFVFLVPDIRDRAAVPGSLGAQFGVVEASLFVALAIWALPALVAGLFEAFVRQPDHVESGSPATPRARPSLSAAILVTAGVALAMAWMFGGL